MAIALYRGLAPVRAVLDNGAIHRSKLTTKALAQRPWLTLEWLPKYAPELNDPGRDPIGANIRLAFWDCS